MFRIIATVAFLCALWMPYVLTPHWTRVAEQLSQSSVPIACSLHSQHSCTAFSINEEAGLYMTAFHCTQPFSPPGDATPDLPTLDGEPLRVLFGSDTLDLAVVQSARTRPALRYRTWPVEVGTTVAAYGYGYSHPTPIFRTGTISGFSRDPHGYEWMMMDNALIRGMSGGPIVDQYARVVGVNSLSDTWSGSTVSHEQILLATRFWE